MQVSAHDLGGLGRKHGVRAADGAVEEGKQLAAPAGQPEDCDVG
jgi:hypothetical protein